MAGGAAMGAVGGALSGPLTGALGSTVGGGIAGAGTPSLASLVAAGGKIAAGMVASDYPSKQLDPHMGSVLDSLKRDGITNSQQYYKAFLDQNSTTLRTLKEVTQGTGKDGQVTMGDLMQKLDPSGQYPTQGEITPDRWKAISPIYQEHLNEQFTGWKNPGLAARLAEAQEGITPDDSNPNMAGSLVPLKLDDTTGLYKAYSPFDANEYGVRPTTTPDISDVPQVENSNLLQTDSEQAGYFTAPRQESTDTPFSRSQESEVDYGRQTARRNSFAAARASEDALRSQSLLQTSKSLNLPDFNEQDYSASKRFTQKPKPFS
jgi:hypothetical protein